MTRIERIYIIGSDGSPIVKIGRSSNLERRLPTLQTGSHLPLHVLWTCAGDSSLESYLHRYFAARCTQGEWFDFGSEDPIHAVKTAIKARPSVIQLPPAPLPEAPAPPDAIRMEEQISARFATEEEAARWSVPVRTALLVIERTYYDPEGAVLEFSTTARLHGGYDLSFIPDDEWLNSQMFA
ncbi:GIY-YIG nuclease family protein [Streptomyces sp. NPDC005732]|uniref:GIY-YIG nuclease family protein n=1 Tax=Streptomyces sp. NPDC005732 TaxID=3157057 RepID=UPI0033E0735F